MFYRLADIQIPEYLPVAELEHVFGISRSSSACKSVNGILKFRISEWNKLQCSQIQKSKLEMLTDD